MVYLPQTWLADQTRAKRRLDHIPSQTWLADQTRAKRRLDHIPSLDRLLQNADFPHFWSCNLLILLTLNFEKCSSVTACRTNPVEWEKRLALMTKYLLSYQMKCFPENSGKTGHAWSKRRMKLIPCSAQNARAPWKSSVLLKTWTSSKKYYVILAFGISATMIRHHKNSLIFLNWFMTIQSLRFRLLTIGIDFFEIAFEDWRWTMLKTNPNLMFLNLFWKSQYSFCYIFQSLNFFCLSLVKPDTGTTCCTCIRLEVIFQILENFYGLVNKKQVPIC